MAISNPVYLTLIAVFFIISPFAAFDKRMTRVGNKIAADGKPTLPKWAGYLFVVQILIRIVLLALNFSAGIAINVAGILLPGEMIGTRLFAILFRSRKREIEQFGRMQ